MTCRTSTGHELDLSEAATLLWWADIRAVLLDRRRVPVDWSTRQRLFRGVAREMALLLADHCVYPGCDEPVGRVQVDHITPYSERGPTRLDNAAPLCGHHNRLKHDTNYHVERLPDGRYLVTDTNDNPI